ncbi:unnamed protein product [Dovyalis caffra]|uniref:Uncharacterized protein n=1 Tax=Dovyalis caffra TaxID=77055 RepID=A0AAV1QT49_9ROSI|nr:unnamed protein product [Dovyalis caffra]
MASEKKNTRIFRKEQILNLTGAKKATKPLRLRAPIDVGITGRATERRWLQIFNTLRLDASTDVRRTAEMIKEFGATGPDTILLASLKSLGGSINMTVASEVYFLEPWWSSEVEEQAIDHVPQYGQQEDVEIIRLIAENTIEERILEMQKKKLENEAS